MTETILNTLSITIPLATGQTDSANSARQLSLEAWQALTDFESWCSWMPNVEHVQRLDEGDPARGSCLRVTAKNSDRIWTINYWEPEKRIEFIIGPTPARSAYRFSFEIRGSGSGELELELILELESACRRLLLFATPAFGWQQHRKGKRLLRSFKAHLLTRGHNAQP